MEVHHHPDLHKGKKFREFFLEFLMIFLAVSMGFIAENIRENISDHAKEKEYIIGLIDNVRVDTMNLHKMIAANQTKLKGIDSLLSLAGQDISLPENRQLFYTYCRRYMNSVSFFHNDNVTLTQLKNAGGYRLIQKAGAADKIATYDQANNAIYTQEDTYNKGLLYAEETLFELIDMTVYNKPGWSDYKATTGKELPPVLNDPQKLKTYFNKVFFSKMVISAYANHVLKDQLERSEQLIDFLQKTYHLENE